MMDFLPNGRHNLVSHDLRPLVYGRFASRTIVLNQNKIRNFLLATRRRAWLLRFLVRALLYHFVDRFGQRLGKCFVFSG